MISVYRWWNRYLLMFDEANHCSHLFQLRIDFSDLVKVVASAYGSNLHISGRFWSFNMERSRNNYVLGQWCMYLRTQRYIYQRRHDKTHSTKVVYITCISIAMIMSTCSFKWKFVWLIHSGTTECFQVISSTYRIRSSQIFWFMYTLVQVIAQAIFYLL